MSTTSAAPAADPQPIRPAMSKINKPFWDGCRAHKLMAQQCTQCRELRYPAAAICPNCLSGVKVAFEERGSDLTVPVFEVVAG